MTKVANFAMIAAAGLAIAGCSDGTSAVQRPDGYTVTTSTIAALVAAVVFAVVMGATLVLGFRHAQRVRPEWGRWWFLPAAVVLVAIPFVVAVTYPSRTTVSVETTSARVVVEREFPLRPSQVETYPFSDVVRVRYHHSPARGEDRARGTVLLDLTNGETVEVFKAGPSAASQLAIAISQFAQVPFSDA